MPIARIKSVFSCNSEDEHFPAENLLKEGKKWKCAEPGIDAAYVVLQLEKQSKITGIDIGNEGSAFITVLVGKNGWTDDRYTEILLTTTFMTPAEARNMENSNRVRCYNPDILVETVRDQKWDMVKLVCSQSYNRKVKYGLAFVKIQISDESNANVSKDSISIISPIVSTDKNTNETEFDGTKLNTSCDDALGLPKNNVFSQFKFREESSDSDNEPASLFNKWKNGKEIKSDNTDDSVISTAAAIRDSSSSISALEKSITIKKMTPNRRTSQDKLTISASDNSDDQKKPLVPNRNRYALIYEDEDDTTSDPKLEMLINADKERIEKEKADRLSAKKKKDNKPDHKQEKNNKKMSTSADKFKQFLDADNGNEPNDEQTENSNEKNDNTQSGNESIAESLSQGENASQSTHGSSSSKRRSDSTVDSINSPMKRPRLPTAASNNDDDDEDDEIPFNTILRGTTFVISGIQNPERASLREKGIKMGAWYKADWDRSCTHLICAFPNTPKYKQVQGVNGKIVKSEWINDCFDQKKKLPWRQYVL